MVRWVWDVLDLGDVYGVLYHLFPLDEYRGMSVLYSVIITSERLTVTTPSHFILRKVSCPLRSVRGMVTENFRMDLRNGACDSCRGEQRAFHPVPCSFMR